VELNSLLKSSNKALEELVSFWCPSKGTVMKHSTMYFPKDWIIETSQDIIEGCGRDSKMNRALIALDCVRRIATKDGNVCGPVYHEGREGKAKQRGHEQWSWFIYLEKLREGNILPHNTSFIF
jgi:hypothetical protein